MEAIIRQSLYALAGAVLGLFVGLALLAAGALNVLNALLAIAVLAVFVGLLIPTSSRPASGVGDRPCGTHESHDAELERWLAARAEMGCTIHPTDVLTAEASRELRRNVSRGQLISAWERFRANDSIRRMLGGVA